MLIYILDILDIVNILYVQFESTTTMMMKQFCLKRFEKYVKLIKTSIINRYGYKHFFFFATSFVLD